MARCESQRMQRAANNFLPGNGGCRPADGRIPAMQSLRIFFRGVLGAMTLATAAAAPVNFNLPAQPAAAALAAFARQAGVEVLFSFDDLKKVPATAVAGSYEPEAALALLLRGTGFTATRNAAGKFVVTRERGPLTAGEIRGTVVAEENGRPVAEATVRVAGAPRMARTDAARAR